MNEGVLWWSNWLQMKIHSYFEIVRLSLKGGRALNWERKVVRCLWVLDFYRIHNMLSRPCWKWKCLWSLCFVMKSNSKEILVTYTQPYYICGVYGQHFFCLNNNFLPCLGFLQLSANLSGYYLLSPTPENSLVRYYCMLQKKGWEIADLCEILLGDVKKKGGFCWQGSAVRHVAYIYIYTCFCT